MSQNNTLLNRQAMLGIILILALCSGGMCALPRYRIIDNERVCWYWFSMDKLDCLNLKTPEPYQKNSYTLKEYIDKFGKPFQLTEAKREVMVRGLIWEQYRSQWILSKGNRAKITLSDMEFHGLYSKHKFFKGK